ncbi:hypothetical protein AVEN_96228-1, partial [Araneus ventricosus]
APQKKCYFISHILNLVIERFDIFGEYRSVKSVSYRARIDESLASASWSAVINDQCPTHLYINRFEEEIIPGANI